MIHDWTYLDTLPEAERMRIIRQSARERIALKINEPDELSKELMLDIWEGDLYR